MPADYRRPCNGLRRQLAESTRVLPGRRDSCHALYHSALSLPTHGLADGEDGRSGRNRPERTDGMVDEITGDEARRARNVGANVLRKMVRGDVWNCPGSVDTFKLWAGGGVRCQKLLRRELRPAARTQQRGLCGAMTGVQSSARGMRRPVSTDSKAASAIASARAPSMPVGEGSAFPSSTSTKWSHSAR